MTALLQIDFVSDVSCPWCAVGLKSLQQALQALGPDIQVQLRMQPFELNPHMPPGGQDMGEHLNQKYGSTPEQQAEIRRVIAERGAQVGFAFHPEGRGRIYNTRDAHRLLHWAGTIDADKQLALKLALLEACHGRQEPMDDHAVLCRAAQAAGLDAQEAAQILASGQCDSDVEEAERFFQAAGIRSVPAVVIGRKHLISGGQPPEVFEQALRQIAAQPA